MSEAMTCTACGLSAPQEELVPYARMFRNSQLVVSRSGDQAERRHESVYRVVARRCTGCGLLQWYARAK